MRSAIVVGFGVLVAPAFLFPLSSDAFFLGATKTKAKTSRCDGVRLRPSSSSAERGGKLRSRSRPMTTARRAASASEGATAGAATAATAVKVGCLLGDLPTPCLLLELSLAEGAAKRKKAPAEGADTAATEEDGGDDGVLLPARNDGSSTSPAFFPSSALDGALFVHTRVVDTSVRDGVSEREGSGKSPAICKLDAGPPGRIPGGAYLGIGLANHLVGGYYWARGMGIGASLPAHGVVFSDPASELRWKRRGPGTDPTETTEESSNSNDGKRSEWADFVRVGDTVQLVPEDATAVLRSSGFDLVLGVRRIGRPLGADPIVEAIWVRRPDGPGKWDLLH